MSISINKIQKEASQKIADNRMQAIILYGAVYTLLLNFFVIANSFSYMWIYAIVLTMALLALLGPISYSLTDFYLLSYRIKTVNIFKTVEGFKAQNLQRSLALHLLRLLIVAVSTLLLIVPGIIYAHRSSMAMYLLRANPKMSAKKALQGSGMIMKGHYKQLFALNMRYAVWFLLSILTLGLGFIIVLPDYYMAKVVFYKRVLQGDTKTYDVEEEVERKKLENEMLEIERMEKMVAFKKITTPRHNQITFSPQIEGEEETDDEFNGQLDFEDEVETQNEIFVEPEDVADLTEVAPQDEVVAVEVSNTADDVVEPEEAVVQESVVEPTEVEKVINEQIEPIISVHEIEEQVIDLVEIDHQITKEQEIREEKVNEPPSEEELMKRLQEEARAKLEAMRREKEERKEREIREKKEKAMQRVAELRAKAAGINKGEKDENE